MNVLNSAASNAQTPYFMRVSRFVIMILQRHSYAAAAIRAGDDMKTVSSNLGHASISVTMDIYAGFTDDMVKASASRMHAYISADL